MLGGTNRDLEVGIVCFKSNVHMLGSRSRVKSVRRPTDLRNSIYEVTVPCSSDWYCVVDRRTWTFRATISFVYLDTHYGDLFE